MGKYEMTKERARSYANLLIWTLEEEFVLDKLIEKELDKWQFIRTRNAIENIIQKLGENLNETWD